MFWAILLKLHILASEMESFLTPYGLSNSGQENLQFTPFWVGPKLVCSDGLRAATIESHNFFCLRSYHGEISHSNSPNRELSNGARVMELYWNRNVDLSRSPCLKAIDRKSFESGNFLVFHSELLNIAYFKLSNWELSIDVQPKELRQRKFVDPSRAAP